MWGKQLGLFCQLELMDQASSTGEALLRTAAPLYVKLPLGTLASKCIPSALCATFGFLTGLCKGKAFESARLQGPTNLASFAFFFF